MIFNDRLMFIHVGKTGGSSCSDHLLRHLQGPAWNCHHDAALELEGLVRDGVDVDGMRPRTDIKRHCTLAEAAAYVHALDGRRLADFEKIVAVVRDPYTLEYSHYHYMKLPAVRAREQGNPGLLERTSGDLLDFVRRAGYHRKGTPQEDYFLVDGVLPHNVELLRHERLAADWPRAVSAFLKPGAPTTLPQVNRTGYAGGIEDEITPEIEALVYRKHRYMFDSSLYPRRLRAATG